MDYRELLRGEVPEGVRRRLPRRVLRLGDVAVVRLYDGEAWRFRRVVGEAVLEAVPGVRCVVAWRGISGRFREPVGEVVAGEGDAETVHVELGVRYRLDPTRVMFAKGNVREKRRLVSRGLFDGASVFDMFAGIGYLSLPVAVHREPEVVYCAELNPVAYRYLVENVGLNDVGDVVVPFLGDCREVARLVPEVDVVIMGYLKGTLEFLDVALSKVRVGGRVMVHEVFPAGWDEGRTAEEVLGAVPGGFEVRVVDVRDVKSYGPGLVHRVVELERLK